MSRAVPRVGPMRGSRGRCDHGDVTFGLDPDPRYLRFCEQRGVFAAPLPEIAGSARLCDYHLARCLEDVDERLEAKLVERGARDHAAEPAFVTIDDAPDEYELLGKTWRLHSIDQRGRAHYLQRGEAVLELRPTFEVEQIRPLRSTSIESYMERLRVERGFAAFAPGIGLPTGGFA